MCHAQRTANLNPRIATKFVVGTHHNLGLVMPTLIEVRTLHPDREQRNQKHIPTGKLSSARVVCATISGVVMVPVRPSTE